MLHFGFDSQLTVVAFFGGQLEIIAIFKNSM
jgi:hypothetical protein